MQKKAWNPMEGNLLRILEINRNFSSHLLVLAFALKTKARLPGRLSRGSCLAANSNLAPTHGRSFRAIWHRAAPA